MVIDITLSKYICGGSCPKYWGEPQILYLNESYEFFLKSKGIWSEAYLCISEKLGNIYIDC